MSHVLDWLGLALVVAIYGAIILILCRVLAFNRLDDSDD